MANIKVAKRHFDLTARAKIVLTPEQQCDKEYVIYKVGQEYELPTPNTSIEGMKFKGWYSDEELNDMVNTSNMPLIKYLYPKFDVA